MNMSDVDTAEMKVEESTGNSEKCCASVPEVYFRKQCTQRTISHNLLIKN